MNINRIFYSAFTCVNYDKICFPLNSTYTCKFWKHLQCNQQYKSNTRYVRECWVYISVEYWSTSYRVNHNFTIKTSCLKFNSETLERRKMKNFNACIPNNMKTSLPTVCQYFQYFDFFFLHFNDNCHKWYDTCNEYLILVS